MQLGAHAAVYLQPGGAGGGGERGGKNGEQITGGGRGGGMGGEVEKCHKKRRSGKYASSPATCNRDLLSSASGLKVIHLEAQPNKGSKQ